MLKMNLSFDFISISELIDFYMKYEWYNIGVEYNLDFNVVQSGIFLSYSSPTFY